MRVSIHHALPFAAVLALSTPAGAQPSASFGEPPAQAQPPAPPPGAPPAPPPQAPPAPPSTAAPTPAPVPAQTQPGVQHPYYRNQGGFPQGAGQQNWQSRPCRPEQQGFAPYQRFPGCAGESPYDSKVPVHLKTGEERGPYYHEGLYFRLGLGLGSSSDSMTAETATFRGEGSFDSVELSQSGFAPGTQLGFGIVVWRGLVLGASIDTATTPGATADSVSSSEGTVGSSYEFRTAQLELFSPMVDWYVMPDKGFHVQAAVGFAAYIAGQGDSSSDGPRLRAHTATGWGLAGGVGYEWWIAEEWGLGLLGRIIYSRTTGTDAVGTKWVHKILSPAVFLTTTYN